MSPTSSIPHPASGLIVRESRQAIALEHVAVSATVTDFFARVTVRQRYRNREPQPLEVVYVFPLDEASAVCGFEVTVDGVRCVGEVKERDEAFKQYDDALEAGHGGFLLDEERADVFTASVGNLKPGSEAELSITYVTELAAEGPAARFTLPTTVSPRYAPDVDRTGVGRTPAESLNPPVELDVPYAFSFEMDVTMGGRIRSVQSPSHPIEVEQEEARARVRLAQREAPMDRDLVIVIAAEGLDAPHTVVERGERGGGIAVSFLPTFESSAQPAEVIFVIDRSGSMQGSSIGEVRNALQLCLRSLTTGCRLDIVSFGNRHASLFGATRPYDEASLREAAAFVAGIDADMGGTELLPALEFVLGLPRVEGLARQVLLLTDGEVTNTDAVIEIVRRHAASARFFTFGIGAGASQHLVRGIARASGGAAEFINPRERIEGKVMRQFARVLAPALTDVRLDWAQPGATPASEQVPPVFAGERLAVYALCDRPVGGAARLTGRLGGRDVSFEIPVHADRAVAGETVATLAARARIRALEERSDYLESRGSRQRRDRSGAKAAAEIAELGVKYQLCSRETSFVAIEHRETPVTERAELRRVPIALTSGWGGVDREGTFAHPQAQFAAPLGAVFEVSCLLVSEAAPPKRQRKGLFARWRAQPAAPAAQTRGYDGADAHSRGHDALVALQAADGSWELTGELARAVGKGLDEIEETAAGVAGDRRLVRRALATALALAWLEREAADARDEWALLAAKGRQWLATCGVSPAAASWDDLAVRVLVQ